MFAIWYQPHHIHLLLQCYAHSRQHSEVNQRHIDSDWTQLSSQYTSMLAASLCTECMWCTRLDSFQHKRWLINTYRNSTGSIWDGEILWLLMYSTSRLFLSLFGQEQMGNWEVARCAKQHSTEYACIVPCCACYPTFEPPLPMQALL